jgi:hypothetical protein
MIALIDAYRGRRLDFDAYLYVVEVLLLPDLLVGRCGRGEGRLVGEYPRPFIHQNCATHCEHTNWRQLHNVIITIGRK